MGEQRRRPWDAVASPGHGESKKKSLDRAPDPLYDLIRFGHAERGVRPELTVTALAAVDAAIPAFLGALREKDEDEAN